MVPVPSSRREGHFQARFSLPVQRWLGSIQVASKWHPSGIQVASKWHPNGTQVASKWHPSGIQVAPKWHPSGIQVASKWHPSVRAHAEEDAEAARELGMVVACIEVAAIPGLAVEVEG